MQDRTEGNANDLLPRLRDEIERAWNARQDHELVHRIAAEHPALADELYDFFADMIEAQEDVGRPRPELADSARRVREYLEREGYQRAAAAKGAATTSITADSPTPTRRVAEQHGEPRTFLGFLRGETGQSVHALADAIGITPDFLVVVSENGAIVPTKARNELVKRVRKVHNLSEAELLASLAVAPPAQRVAASRPKAYTAKTVSFEALVNASGLDPEQKEYWRSLA